MTQFDFNAVKDEVIANIGQLSTETAKTTLFGWFKNTALPYAEEVAAAYVDTLKKQAETEAGWCKIRDRIVLPTLISVAEFAVEKTLDILETAIKEEEKPAEAPTEKPAETVAIAQV